MMPISNMFCCGAPNPAHQAAVREEKRLVKMMKKVDPESDVVDGKTIERFIRRGLRLTEPEHHAAFFARVKKKKVKMNAFACEGAVTTLVRAAADLQSDLAPLRLALLFGRMRAGDAKVKKTSHAAAYLQTLPKTAVALSEPDEMLRLESTKEAAYGLAVACRVAVEKVHDRIDVQQERQEYIRRAGKALNIVAGTFPWTGGAGTLAESGMSKFADRVFSTRCVNPATLAVAIDDLVKRTKGDIVAGAMPEQRALAIETSKAFGDAFAEAWDDLVHNSEAVRVESGKKILSVV